MPDPDVVVVPGGPGSFAATTDPVLLAYLTSAHESGALMTSVCTGALVLGAAGLLEGRRAATHWAYRDLLPKFGATATGERWVRDGEIWTSAGVTAGLDMALALAEELTDRETADLIRLDLEYEAGLSILDRLRTAT